jgi:hypothetical protein
MSSSSTFRSRLIAKATSLLSTEIKAAPSDNAEDAVGHQRKMEDRCQRTRRAHWQWIVPLASAGDEAGSSLSVAPAVFSMGNCVGLWIKPQTNTGCYAIHISKLVTSKSMLPNLPCQYTALFGMRQICVRPMRNGI